MPGRSFAWRSQFAAVELDRAHRVAAHSPRLALALAITIMIRRAGAFSVDGALAQTDIQSGKELRQIPPAEIRSVREGIAAFLKQEEAKAHSRLEVKA